MHAPPCSLCRRCGRHAAALALEQWQTPALVIVRLSDLAALVGAAPTLLQSEPWPLNGGAARHPWIAGCLKADRRCAVTRPAHACVHGARVKRAVGCDACAHPSCTRLLAQVNLSAFGFLFSELVQYCQKSVMNIPDLERK